MLADQLPDIPRILTGIAEWAAAALYVFLLPSRYSPKVRAAVVAAALPLFILLQVFLETWPIALWMLGMVTAIAAMYALVFGLTRTSWKDAGYVTARVFVLAELVASLEWQLWTHWDPSFDKPTPDSGRFYLSLASVVIVYSLAFGIVYLLERRNYSPDQPLATERRSLLSAVSIAVATFLVSNVSFAFTATPFSATGGASVFYVRTLVDLAGFVALYAQQSYRNHLRDAHILSQMQGAMQAQYDQHLQSQRNIQELNRMHHDLKYYAQAIRLEDSAEKRSEYLQILEDSIRGYESEIVTGNQFLDVILSSKAEKCLQEDITFTVMAEGQSLEFMDAMGLSVFFGNALDNAIEASGRIPDAAERLIKVSIDQQGDFALIRIENHYPGRVTFVGSSPVTTKENRSQHGFGTASMRSVIEAYNGVFTVGLTNNWYTVRALVPIPPA